MVKPRLGLHRAEDEEDEEEDERAVAQVNKNASTTTSEGTGALQMMESSVQAEEDRSAVTSAESSPSLRTHAATPRVEKSSNAALAFPLLQTIAAS